MKLHFTYNLANLSQALAIAQQTAEYADILGIGSLLLFKEGVKAITTFKTTFPNKEIFAEAKIAEKGDEVAMMMSHAGANYVSILAGSFTNTIKKTVSAAKSVDLKVALDLLDAQSFGQSAMDAKTLGVNLIIVHRFPLPNESGEIESEWQNVKDNTNLPIFITGKIDEGNIKHVIALKPQGIMIGSAITKADNPAKVAQAFRALVD